MFIDEHTLHAVCNEIGIAIIALIVIAIIPWEKIKWPPTKPRPKKK